MNYGPYEDLDALGIALAAEICGGPNAPIEGSSRDAAAIIAATLQRNFATATAIEREVDEQIAKLGSQTAGMDTHKLRIGLRERIAKQRGFVL
jgi:hypothetical protein